MKKKIVRTIEGHSKHLVLEIINMRERLNLFIRTATYSHPAYLLELLLTSLVLIRTN